MTFIPDVAKALTTSAQRLDSETETLLACRSEEVNGPLAFHHTQDPIHGPVSPALGSKTDGMGVCVTGSVTHTLKAEGFDASEDGTGRGQPITVSPALLAKSNDSHDDSKQAYAVDAMRVRRLTPRECERLQGFPDDHTLITYRGKPASDGPRYRAIGNSKAVPVVRWLGRRIQFVDGLEVLA